MIVNSLSTWLKQILGVETFTCTPILEGANNLGYKIQTTDKQWFVKCYPPNAPYVQVKQKNEFSFSQAIYHAGVHNTPTPIAINLTCHASIFEYIQGEKISVTSLQAINAARTFLQDINNCQLQHPINIASESPNSLQGFVDIVVKRLEKLATVQIEDEKLAKSFFDSCERVSQRLNTIQAMIPENWQQPVERNIVSPSDFGFHNTIKTDSKFYFIDFEYAGLDTPWKVFADFFAQPSVPVDIAYAKRFLTLNIFEPLRKCPQNTTIVYELTLLKWCLIMLNEFLPDVQARRLFSSNISCLKEQKDKLLQVQRAQLEKCNAYYEKIPLKVKDLEKTLRGQV